jgi:hypothetical protein
MPVRTLSGAQGDTLAPWVLRVGALTSSRAASRMRRRPGGRCETSRRARAGPGTPAPPIPALIRRRTAIGAAPPQPGRPLLPVGHGRPLAGPRRAAPPRRVTRPPEAGPRPPALGRRPAAGHPARAPGRPLYRHPVAGHPARAPGRPPYRHPVAGHHVTGHPARAPGPPRCCHRAAPPPRPGHPGQVRPHRGPRRRVARPTPAAVHRPRGPPRRAFPPPSGPPLAGGHRGG